MAVSSPWLASRPTRWLEGEGGEEREVRGGEGGRKGGREGGREGGEGREGGREGERGRVIKMHKYWAGEPGNEATIGFLYTYLLLEAGV